MSNMEQQLLKLLMDREFYTANKDRIVKSMFPGDLGTIFDTVTFGQLRYDRGITLDEVRALHRTQHPTLSRAARNNIEELFTDLEQLPPLSEDVAGDVLSYMWRVETFRQIADIALKGIDGEIPDLESIRSITESRSESFLPADDVEFVPTDLDELLVEIGNSPRWKFNIPSLAEKIPGVSGGELGIILARPNVGKSASHVSLSTAPDGWCWQGANVHVIANEEPGRRTMLRAVSAACQKPAEWVMANRVEAAAIWNSMPGKYVIADAVGMSIGRLDAYARRHKPDILVVDQLDKIHVSGQFGGSHEKLGAIYIAGREIAKKHDLFLLALTQASAEAEGKAAVHYSHMAGSKTDKAAEADFILGIGKYPQPEMAEAEDFTRVLTVSKNKLPGGWHGNIACTLDPHISTYNA